jgi:hypothetical protein
LPEAITIEIAMSWKALPHPKEAQAMTDPAITPREDERLEELQKTHPDPLDLSNKAAGTSEETAGLFNSPHKPEPEQGTDPRSE